MEGKKFYLRTGAIAAVALAVLLVFTLLLYENQVIIGVDEATTTAINTVSSTESVSAARGLITDCNGVVLVGNRTEYQVSLDVEDMGDYEDQAAVILRLLEICALCDITWKDTEMPISSTQPYTFTAGDEAYSYIDSDTGEATATRLSKMCDAMGWTKSDSADELIAQMKATFGLTGADESTARSALGVLYSCYLRYNEILWTDYVFASDVDITMISIIQEEGLAGVTVSAASVRQFYTTYAAHLLGQTGYITAENWSTGENYKAQGYSMDATVGLSGVEYAFESYLKGTDGTRTVTTNSDGAVISEEETVPALAGSDVMLTLDSVLQAAVEDALAEYTPQINDSEGGSAAVVLSVSDGSLLASASWPTYDAATLTYDEAYADLSPLFNRALQGTYSPGSTYKMVTATAALETGIITTSTRILDTGYMDYYGTVFRCWIYRSSGSNHGYETVSDAIRDSCNIFFYTVAIEMGIDTLTEYAQSFGLGVSTGIELTEATGINAGPEYSSSVGSTWYGGNLLSAAIGQSDNQFTPLQIASYLATLVNGGTRYAVHLLKSVTAADGTVTEYEPEILSTVSISEASLAAIKQGMLEVVENTSAVKSAFATLNANGITVGAKTGSAQITGQESANGLFVCFAPYDNPEVVVCVAVEKGGSGADTAIIAAKILEAYFGISTEEDTDADADTDTVADSADTGTAAQTAETGTANTAGSNSGSTETTDSGTAVTSDSADTATESPTEETGDTDTIEDETLPEETSTASDVTDTAATDDTDAGDASHSDSETTEDP